MSSSALLPRLPVTDEWLAKKLAAEGQRKLKQKSAPKRDPSQRFQPRPNLPKATADWFAKLCPHTPHAKQQAFLDSDAREVLFGGGGRGGKTDAALMRLLKYADVPGYAGLGLRVNFQQMMKPDAILARAIEWWRGQPMVKYDAQLHSFRFSCPGGGFSEIVFGHMESSLSFYDYQGMAAQCVIFDELTHFQEQQYKYLFSRQSKPTDGPAASIPLFMGSTANPGGVGHRWVYERFVDPEKAATRKAVWIPSTVDDNPSVDLKSYEESLEELDPVTREQLRHGSWDELAPGDFFDQSNFVLIEEPPPRIDAMVRYWDFASSDPSKKRGKKTPDATASCLMGAVNAPGDPARGIKAERVYYVLDVTEDMWAAGDVPTRVGLQAAEDGVTVAVRWEEEGGSSGQIASERAIKPELAGYDADGIRSTGSKLERARPYSAAVSKRKVFVLKRAWTKKWMDQHHQFPAVDHDDMVDASSGAFNHIDSAALGMPVVTRGGGGVTGSLTTDKSGRRVRMFG